jgi:hypothetical protein
MLVDIPARQVEIPDGWRCERYDCRQGESRRRCPLMGEERDGYGDLKPVCDLHKHWLLSDPGYGVHKCSECVASMPADCELAGVPCIDFAVHPAVAEDMVRDARPWRRLPEPWLGVDGDAHMHIPVDLLSAFGVADDLCRLRVADAAALKLVGREPRR